MQMPEPAWNAFPVRGGSQDDTRAWEHSVTVLLPWRRYDPTIHPQPAAGSPSRVYVGEETRHGAELSIIRVTVGPYLGSEVAGEMLGVLAEAWATLTHRRPGRDTQ